VALVASSVVHLWNPIGYPTLHVDEGTYMRRAMHILEGLGLKEELWGYDHPFFGPLFLASTLFILGYPSIVSPDLSNKDSFRSLYLVPRLIMGILAVIDTYLVYKIGEIRYGKKVALIAALLFAVMPFTWLLRRIYLESILLPFLLASILFAIKPREDKHRVRLECRSDRIFRNRENRSQILQCYSFSILISGVFLGLAIFTKVPIIIMIPLLAYLVYKSSRNIAIVGLWSVPVILIPIIWPVHAALKGDLGEWVSGISWQLSRINNSFLDSIYSIFVIDPGLAIISAMGIAFAVYKRDFLIILWVLPLTLLFGIMLNYVNWFHWIPIQPALCMAAASFIHNILITSKVRKNFRVIFGVSIAAIVIFGVIGTGSLITLDLSTFQFESFIFAGKLLANGTNNLSQVSDSKKQHENDLQGEKIAGLDLDKLTIISSPIYSWVFKYVFDYGERAHASYLEGKIVKADQTVLIVDRYFRDYLMTEYQSFQYGDTSTRSDFEQLVQIDNESKTLALFDGITSKFDRFSYPFTSLRYNFGGSPIEVKVR
jgi:Dolichyl-phosphate-mannose-protein mannosyltransferase